MNRALEYHRDFYPVDMTGCILYLPFHRYGSEQSKILDQSGNGNHGTIAGAVPTTNSNKVTNGDFDADESWTKGGGATAWTIGDGVASKSAGDAGDLEQNISVAAGVWYRLQYTLTRTAGVLTPQLGGVNGTARSLAGTYAQDILATGTGNLKFQANNLFAGTVDRVTTHALSGFIGWQFDGEDATKITVAEAASMEPATAYTLMAWIYPTLLDWTAGIFNKHVTGPATGHQLLIRSDGKITAEITGNNIFWDGTGSLTVPLHKWSQISFVVNVPTATAYMDGVTGEGDTSTGDGASLVYPVADTPWVIGNHNTSGGYGFVGSLGDVLMFNRALSASEVKAYYQLTRHRYGV